MGGRARGSDATLAIAFEAEYGTPPDDGNGTWLQAPFVSSQLGEERPLIASDLLGYGRESQDPTQDVATNDGDLVVPVDLRYIWIWLRGLLGDPATSDANHATGTVTFTDMPAVGSTVTFNGTAFTFVSAAPAGNQVQITSGLSLNGLVGNLATALNASAVAGVAAASYSNSGHVLTVTYDALGPGGNAYTLAAQAGAKAVLSGARLGGGGKKHVFTSGAITLPSLAAQITHPRIPTNEVHFGIFVNQLKIAMSRSGLLNATVSCIAQGEADPNPVSIAGSPAEMTVERFAQATGSVSRNGDTLGNVATANITLSNNGEKVEVIRADGRIGGVDPDMVGFNATVEVLYQDTDMIEDASNGTPCSVTFGWKKGPWSLVIAAARTFLPKAKRPVPGPKGIKVSYDIMGSGALGNTFTVTLINDVVDYSAKLDLPVETFSETLPVDGDA